MGYHPLTNSGSNLFFRYVFPLTFLFAILLPSAAFSKSTNGKPTLYVVHMPHLYPFQDPIKNLNAEMKNLGFIFTTIEVINSEEADYVIKGLEMGTINNRKGLVLTGEFLGPNNFATKIYVLCKRCRKPPEQVIELVESLLSTTIFHPQNGPFGQIRIESCEKKGKKLILDLQFEKVVRLEKSLTYEVGWIDEGGQHESTGYYLSLLDPGKMEGKKTTAVFKIETKPKKEETINKCYGGGKRPKDHLVIHLNEP